MTTTSITGTLLFSPPAVTPANALTVAKAGGDYTSIAAALAAATAGQVVQVYPGDYAEPALTVPTGVSLEGIDFLRCRILSSAAGVPAVSMTDNTALNSLSILATTADAGVAVDVAATIGTIINEVLVFSAPVGFRDASTGTNVTFQTCGAIGCTTAGYLVTGAGTEADILSSGCIGTVAQTSGFRVTDNARATLTSCKVDGNNVIVDGYHVDAGAVLSAQACAVTDCVNGLHINTGGGDLGFTAGDVRDSTGFDLLVDDSPAIVRMGATRADTNKFSVLVSTELQGLVVSDTEDQEGAYILGNLVVGRPEKGQQAAFGEGASHVFTLVVKTNTNGEVGTWVDETANAKSASGSTFNLFPGVGVNNACYVGCNLAYFPFLFFDVLSKIVKGAGAFVSQYWDGATWVAFDVMGASVVTPHASVAQDVFASDNTKENVRFDMTDLIAGGWTNKTLDGVDTFWLRFVLTGAITTSPVIQQIRLGTSHTHTAEDGALSFFGTAEPVDVEIDLGPNRQSVGGGSVPTNQNVTVSANVKYKGERNGYGQGDAVVYAVALAEGVDTSREFVFTSTFIPSTSGAGTIKLEVIIVPGAPGGVLGTLTELAPIVIDVAAPGVANQIVQAVHRFRVPDITPGEGFWLRHGRMLGADGDTYGGRVDMIERRLTGTFYKPT